MCLHLLKSEHVTGADIDDEQGEHVMVKYGVFFGLWLMEYSQHLKLFSVQFNDSLKGRTGNIFILYYYK